MSSRRKVDFKVVLLGSVNSGKTCLVRRFVHERFDGRYETTVGAAFGSKTVTVSGKPFTMGVWDTAGQERYEAISRTYYRDASAAIVCYDLTDNTCISWNKARFWVQEVKRLEGECKIYLCGTKRDLLETEERSIHYKATTDYAGTIGAGLFETSSKSGVNVTELFMKIASDYLNTSKKMSVEEKPADKIKLTNNPWHKRLSALCC